MKVFRLTEIFESIVSEISTELTPELQKYDESITGVHYMFGHIIEIRERLESKSLSKDGVYDKYPLVILLEDIDHNRGIGYAREEFFATAYVDIVIVYGTRKEYISKEREAKTFEPVLNPIYELLLEKVAENKAFVHSPDPMDLQHTATPRKYWGRHLITVYERGQKDSGVKDSALPDHIDAIDIHRLRLTLDEEQCEKLLKNKII